MNSWQWSVVAAGLCVAAVLLWPAGGPKDRFSAAVNELGVTDTIHTKLRDDFERAALEMQRAPCDEDARARVGRAAVAYYETLLEKPFVKANLRMTRRGVCTGQGEAKSEPLSLIEAFRGGLRLPWDCMPEEWRTPLDLALQAKLEGDIRSIRLTTESLSGTLGLLSQSWEQSSYRHACEPRAPRPESKKRLPILAEPVDDWSRSRRR